MNYIKKIALIDNEAISMKNKSFPNLALMRISTYYKHKGYDVEWFDLFNQEHYEFIFLSKVFTYTKFAPIYDYLDKTKLIVGGTGIDVKIKLDDEIEKCYPDYSIYDVDYAIGFLTRGCNNNCSWCIVPKKEGQVYHYANINEIARVDTNKVVLLDNNILQHENHLKLLEEVACSNYKIDFNQGMDIRMVNERNAKLLSKIKWIKYIRFSCDQLSQIEYFSKNLKLLQDLGVAESKFFIYLLVKEVSDAEKRVEFFRNNFPKVTIYAQVYRDFKNEYKSTQQQRDFTQRYVYKGLWRKETFSEYYCRMGKTFQIC